MIDYNKTIIKNLIIAVSIAIATTFAYHFLWNGEFKSDLLVFFGSFGVSLIPIIVYMLMYSKKNDPSEFATMYFYEGYSECGVSRVYKLHGNPDDKQNLQRTYNYIDKEGKYLFDEWFIGSTGFDDKYHVAIVLKEDMSWWVINNEGKFVTKRPYPYMSTEITGGTIKVMNENQEVNFVDVNSGIELWPVWKKEM